MLINLQTILPALPKLTRDVSKWQSLIINRRHPHTYRIFTVTPEGIRICLHKFDPCHTHESFYHPHPWPGAFLILKGAYHMKVGQSRDRTGKPNDVINLLLNKGSSYEITNPLTWHSITPVKTTYTVMVNDTPWSPDIAHLEVRTTKGKDLDSFSKDELESNLKIFRKLIKRIIK